MFTSAILHERTISHQAAAVAGDSGDEAYTAHLSEEDHSDETEEHVAALSLLSFARFAPSHRPGGAPRVSRSGGLSHLPAGHAAEHLIQNPLVCMCECMPMMDLVIA